MHSLIHAITHTHTHIYHSHTHTHTHLPHSHTHSFTTLTHTHSFTTHTHTHTHLPHTHTHRYNETRWEGDVIVVLGDVRISPPYTPDSCTGISSTLVARIEKLVSTCVSLWWWCGWKLYSLSVFLFMYVIDILHFRLKGSKTIRRVRLFDVTI